jgi:hypothetical protein
MQGIIPATAAASSPLSKWATSNPFYRTFNRIYNRAIEGVLMSQLTANDLKVRGISAIESALADQTEATISVRGAQRYVIMEMAQYHYLRECELEAALAQSRADVAAGRVVQESAEAHLSRLDVMVKVNESSSKK